MLAVPEWLSKGLTTVLSIVVAILVLLVMITVHELGHYLAGKALKFKITEFAIGFGKPIFRRVGKSGETFSVRILPLGGYCAFEGETDEKEGVTASEGSYFAQKPWKRLIVQFAGAFMNFAFSMLVVILTFTCYGQFLYRADSVLPDANGAVIAEEYKLKQGDVLVAVNGRSLYTTEDLPAATKHLDANTKIPVTVIRDGEKMQVTVVWRDYTAVLEDGTVQISTGLGIMRGIANHRFGFWESLGRSFVYVFRMLTETLKLPVKLITGAVGVDQMGGPITTITMTAEKVLLGFHYLLEITAMIGISLAVFNLFPIPGLDGAHMVFTLIEWIRKKPINRKVENMIHLIGMLMLFGLVILVDLLHLLT